MKRILGIAMGAVVAAGLMAGCEWSTSSEHNSSWNDSYNWVNFSGTYRSAAGGMLVTDYTSTPSTPGSTNRYDANQSATLPANAQTAGGTLKYRPLVPGSVVVTVADSISLSDDGNEVLSGPDGSSGKVSYEGGTWSINLPKAKWPTQQTISIRYSYQVSNSGSSSGAKSGSSGKAIYSFVVAQQGEKLTITDNNGAAYKGHISNLRSTSGVASTNSLPRDGDVIVASFSTSGTSAAGKQVTITGTFQGSVAASVFTGRTMQGTWIEAGGKTGDINGTTTSVAIPVAASTTETETTTAE
ncbi:MAG: hypothetical protein IKQ15_08515 [Kiritimatiellae bacterium]|nr:hypothetical protein [Kiritimatiellia bacterium]